MCEEKRGGKYEIYPQLEMEKQPGGFSFSWGIGGISEEGYAAYKGREMGMEGTEKRLEGLRKSLDNLRAASLKREVALLITLWPTRDNKVQMLFYAHSSLLLKAEGKENLPLFMFHPNPPKEFFPTDEAFVQYCLRKPCEQDLPLAVLAQLGSTLTRAIQLLPISVKGRIEILSISIPYPWKELGSGLVLSPEVLDLMLPAPMEKESKSEDLPSLLQEKATVEVWKLVEEDPF